MECGGLGGGLHSLIPHTMGQVDLNELWWGGGVAERHLDLRPFHPPIPPLPAPRPLTPHPLPQGPTTSPIEGVACHLHPCQVAMAPLAHGQDALCAVGAPEPDCDAHLYLKPLLQLEPIPIPI